ncbi:DUF4123 domain-containing protein [Duganella caerulea]|uniref:DUF4123 domain-containing protein n=1 Tax=Duganella caerulea TaxID=2885762 RepID=UPI0040379117
MLLDVCNLPPEFNCEPLKMIFCVPPELTNNQDLMPCLISVEVLSLAQLEQVIEIFRQQQAAQHPFTICAWLDCDLSIEELAVHIASFLSGLGPDGTSIFWRYFDPRVFSITMHLFTRQQRTALLGPIKNWWFTWCGNWWLVKGGADEADRLTSFQTGWPTVEQWPSILQSRVLHRVLAKYFLNSEPTALECLRYLKSSIEYLKDGALTLGLADEDDQFEFAYLCVRYGEAYRRHPKLIEGWILLQQGKISWTALRLQLGQADFDRLNISLDS